MGLLRKAVGSARGLPESVLAIELIRKTQSLAGSSKQAWGATSPTRTAQGNSAVPSSLSTKDADVRSQLLDGCGESNGVSWFDEPDNLDGFDRSWQTGPAGLSTVASTCSTQPNGEPVLSRKRKAEEQEQSKFAVSRRLEGQVSTWPVRSNRGVGGTMPVNTAPAESQMSPLSMLNHRCVDEIPVVLESEPSRSGLGARMLGVKSRAAGDLGIFVGKPHGVGDTPELLKVGDQVTKVNELDLTSLQNREAIRVFKEAISTTGPVAVTVLRERSQVAEEQ